MKCFFVSVFYCLLIIVISKQAITDKDGKAADIRANLTTLIHVHAMWRHGDRTPINLLPNDNKESWEIGLGELTVDGIWQAYHLGKLLRQRYDGFLSKTFKTSEIYVRSTDINRTLMTANAVLQGLYPQTYHSDNLSSVWHPIPVHTVQAENDKQLLQQDCPKVKEELKEVLRTKTVQDMLKMNEGFLRYIGKHMNVESGYYDFENIWLVYDSLKVITCHKDKHQFPKWVNETVWNKISEMFNLWGQYEYSTDLLKRLQGGELWKEIFARLNNLMKEHSTWKQKMYAYSAHDDTLAVLLSMFGMKLTAYPPYAALVLLETHQIDNQFILQLYYKNVTDSNQIYHFPIAYCDKICTVENLEVATSNFIPLNWKMECDPFVLYRKMSTFGLFISVISIVAVISCQILKSHLMKRKIYGDRTVLPSDADVALLREDVIR
ncbi:Histidine acid phosphatase family protein [Brugia malayi]|uniref:Histidine acid phosphatase family protein n=1 Tax=Brugia malayi TaxID=6279 RepID=A0A4E9F5I3_BRUMA|nr:Histidine acid phosphatase family protein [Brugia malayi]VIO92053.1 Histidine acid phosphatase family protein [Brugia malayi]